MGAIAMKEGQCERVEEMSSFIESEQPIPEGFSAHARECNDCLFWLSYGLAIEEAYFTVSRYQRTGTPCPSRETFRDLLISGARTIFTLRGIISKKSKWSMSRIQHLTAEETKRQFRIWDHLNNNCLFCGLYYDTLFSYMLTAQERYELEIKNGRCAITPVIKGPGSDLETTESNFVLFGKSSLRDQ